MYIHACPLLLHPALSYMCPRGTISMEKEVVRFVLGILRPRQSFVTIRSFPETSLDPPACFNRPITQRTGTKEAGLYCGVDQVVIWLLRSVQVKIGSFFPSHNH
ncbi:hypothetical protein F5882DRAFT_414969 [Hyaloscypha sp. PMI_1271]|nr:hypothetical protein F5882DRAFT_414969 [Hyaloscypha sp. PMI_1271]